MGERVIELSSIPPLELFGVNDRKLRAIARHFPKLKIVGRGIELKVIGDEESLAVFEEKFATLIEYYDMYGVLPLTEMERVMKNEDTNKSIKKDDKVLVYGPGGNVIKARTKSQQSIITAIDEKDMVFVIGPAGSGKTYTAVAMAVRALKSQQVKRIILTRPAVEAGESIGFLPGDLKEKLDPYLQPLYDALMDMIPPAKLRGYLEDGTIQIAPLGFMRGRTLDNAFVILDEAQNTTDSQMRMFLTRMGRSAKFVITGDVTQVDLPRSAGPSGLFKAWTLLKNVNDIGFIELGQADIIRHNLVKKIVDSYEKDTDKDKNSKGNKEK